MIRPGELRDLELLVKGNLAMARETEGLELDESILREGVCAVLLGDQPGTYRVLELEGKIAAQLMLTYEWSDWRNAMVWWIQSVYVWPKERGRGRFAELYRSVVTEAEDRGAAGVRLYVDLRNRRARDVYAALGMDGEHYQVFEQLFDSA
jgi:GNAT superfamily N-acetyltransferase